MDGTATNEYVTVEQMSGVSNLLGTVGNALTNNPSTPGTSGDIVFPTTTNQFASTLSGSAYMDLQSWPMNASAAWTVQWDVNAGANSVTVSNGSWVASAAVTNNGITRIFAVKMAGSTTNRYYTSF